MTCRKKEICKVLIWWYHKNVYFDQYNVLIPSVYDDIVKMSWCSLYADWRYGGFQFTYFWNAIHTTRGSVSRTWCCNWSSMMLDTSWCGRLMIMCNSLATTNHRKLAVKEIGCHLEQREEPIIVGLNMSIYRPMGHPLFCKYDLKARWINNLDAKIFVHYKT